jgi:hypothetical protein
MRAYADNFFSRRWPGRVPLKVLLWRQGSKTVRLCLQLGREDSLPWAAKLDPGELPTGSD